MDDKLEYLADGILYNDIKIKTATCNNMNDSHSYNDEQKNQAKITGQNNRW